jgi:hypothetical protein
VPNTTAERFAWCNVRPTHTDTQTDGRLAHSLGVCSVRSCKSAGLSWPANVRSPYYPAAAGGPGSANYKAFTTEVSDDLHASAECRDVGSKGPQLAGVDFGAFDRGYPFLAHLHPIGDLGLGQSEALAHLGKSVGSADVDESLSTSLDLSPIRSVGKELSEEALAVVSVGAAHDSSFSFR